MKGGGPCLSLKSYLHLLMMRKLSPAFFVFDSTNCKITGVELDNFNSSNPNSLPTPQKKAEYTQLLVGKEEKVHTHMGSFPKFLTSVLSFQII